MPEAEQYTVLVARFPHCRAEDPDTTDWMITTILQMTDDPRIKEFLRYRKDDTPITMGRNHCLDAAIRSNIDFLLMIDSDMSPDCNLESNKATEAVEPAAKPFWSTSFDFAIQKRKEGNPCVVGAPYLGPSPINNVYVFQWITATDKHDSQPSMSLAQFGREEAARLHGIQEVAALPTGVILIDMQAIHKFAEHHDPPFFYYEYDDDHQTKKASTEDVTFTRDLSLAGIPQYCNWDAWAGHWKRELVTGPPKILRAEMLSKRFRKAVLRDAQKNDRTTLVEAKDGRIVPVEGNGKSLTDKRLIR